MGVFLAVLLVERLRPGVERVGHFGECSKSVRCEKGSAFVKLRCQRLSDYYSADLNLGTETTDEMPHANRIRE